jgi:hypothetical protein
MYAMPEELSDLPTLMNNLLGSAATFRGHPDGAGTARLLEAAAQALQQQVAETKVRRHHRHHTRNPSSPAHRSRGVRPAPEPPVHRALSPAPHPSPAPPTFQPLPPPWACGR